MTAGSGIRWNSVTKKIQMMDENQNWIDYKAFDPERYYIFKSGEIDNSEGWYYDLYNTNYGKFNYTADYITMQNLRDSEADVGCCPNTSFDLSLYNRLSMVYTTFNANKFSSTGDQINYWNCLYITSGKMVKANPNNETFQVVKKQQYNVDSSTISTPITVTLDISDVNIIGYVCINFINNPNNTLTFTELYFWNNT